MANINKNIIMQAGAAVANATNKAAGLSTTTPEPGSIISAIQLVNGGRTIGPAALADFTESVRNKLLSLLVSMEPIQDFNGYGHPWPAGGGKNKLVYPYDDSTPQTSNGVTFTPNSDGSITVNGTATANAVYTVHRTISLPDGSYTLSGGKSAFKYFGLGYFATDSDESVTRVDSTSESGANFDSHKGSVSYIQLVIKSGQTCNNEVFYPMIRPASVSDATFAPYSNICPIGGRTGLDAYVAPTSAIGDATTYSMDWTTPAGTIYAGSADVVSGDIKAAPYYASYNGETLVGPWVSSMDVYDPEGTPTTGAQVVDLGGAMTEYHITGQDIITLVGANYIWSDSGDVTITE